MPPIQPPRPLSRRRSSESVRLVVLVASLVTIVLFTVFHRTRVSNQPVVEASQPTPSPPSTVELVECLVATEKIEAGTPLDPTRFKRETRPVISNSAEVVTSFDKLRGAYAASFIAAGQPLLSDYVTTKAPVNEIQANISEGFRAVAVSVDDVSNVEGWVRAGAKVDVMLASNLNGKPVITLLAQNAKVLSAGKIGSGPNDIKNSGSTTITIMVTVDEATKIQLASSSGVMSLSLRGDEDTVESPDNQTVTLDTVFGLATPQPQTGPPREGRITFGGRNYVILGGKLVPEDSEAAQNIPR